MAAPFYYVDGDRTKTPVNLEDQPQGTRMVLVSAAGRDIHFTVGKRQVNDPATIQTRFTRGHNSNNHDEG